MRRIYFLLVKEFKQIFRTREMAAIIFGIPLIQMVILGFTITNEVKNVSLIISDRDQSYASRDITLAFSNSDRFVVRGFENNQQRLEESLQSWQAQIVVIIPDNFERDLKRGLHPEIQLLLDGIDGNSAGIAAGYAQGILTQVMSGFRQHTSVKIHPLVTIEDRPWYNVNFDNAQYMIPGIVVVLVTIISMMLSAINLVREKEIGTLEQLMVSPLKRHQMLLGKILPFLILTFIELAIVMTFAQIIFSIKMVGSYILLASLAFLYLFTTLGLGIFVSTVTKTQQQAMFTSWFFMVFMLLMSGFFIPIENMPPVLQKITYLNPMRYFMYITRDIIQKGSTLSYLLVEVIPMTLYGILIFTFSTLKFHKRMA